MLPSVVGVVEVFPGSTEWLGFRVENGPVAAVLQRSNQTWHLDSELIEAEHLENTHRTISQSYTVLHSHKHNG